MSIPLYLSAIYILFTKNSLHAVLALTIGFLNAAIILLGNNCEFIAMIFLVVYIGAICVLFLFVIMLLNLRSYHRPIFPKASLIIVASLGIISFMFLHSTTPAPKHTILGIEANSMTFGLEYFIQEESLLILLTLLLVLAILGPVLISNKHTFSDIGKLQEQYYALTRGANTRVLVLSFAPFAPFIPDSRFIYFICIVAVAFSFSCIMLHYVALLRKEFALKILRDTVDFLERLQDKKKRFGVFFTVH